MNAGVKRRWVEALRGGRYCVGNLPELCYEAPRAPMFSVYGVLCDVLHIPYTTKNGFRRYGVQQRLAMLPHEAADAAGLPRDALVFVEAALVASFIELPRKLRDANYVTLEELNAPPNVLADIIERTTWRGRQ